LTVQPILEGVGSFMSVDSATSLRLRAEWQGWEAYCEDGRFGIRETNQKGLWGCTI